MKIAIASDLYWPAVNGVSTFCRSLAEGFIKEGHEVLVLAPSQTGSFSVDKEDGCTVVRLDSIRFPFHPNQVDPIPDSRRLFRIPVPRFIYRNGLRVCVSPYRKVKDALDGFCPDVIHSHTPLKVGASAYRYSKLHPVPLVYTTHTFPDNTTGNLWFIRPIKKPTDFLVKSYCTRALLRSDYATLPTTAVMDALIPAYMRKNIRIPIEALANGINLSRFSARSADPAIFGKYGIPADVAIVSYIGRLDKEKSLDILVESFAKVLKTAPAHLLLVGDGADKADLKGQVGKLGISGSVTFTGKVVGDDLQELFRAGTVFCTASVTEVQSIAMLEAMASGQPTVVVDVPSMRALCENDVNGYLCEVANTGQIAEKLVKVISDPMLRARLSEGSVRKASEFDIKYSVARFVRIYEKAITVSRERRSE